MKKGLIRKGFNFYKKYGFRGGIATLTGKWQIKDSDYAAWYEKNKVTIEELEIQRNMTFDYMPEISILVPVYNTPSEFLHDMIRSVQNQSYQRWQLCIANANPENEEVNNILQCYTNTDDRIQVGDVPENLGIAQNTNKALDIAKGDYIGLLDHDDIIAPNALFEVAKAINEKKADVLYTNEDKITMHGEEHFQPNFKPDFNLDLLRSNNYICHFFVAKASLIKEIGGFRREYNGAQDHDLIFRCTEKAKKIVKISKVLYHWRMHKQSTAENPESKKYAFIAGKKAIEDHLKRSGEKAEVNMTEYPGFFRVKYEMEQKPEITVVIVKDKKKMVSKEILIKLADDYGRELVEFVIVDGTYSGDIRVDGLSIRTIPWEKDNDYIDMLNCGINSARNEYILLLSADTKEVADHYLRELVSNAMRKDVGAVGGKIYFPNKTIKNAGFVKQEDGIMQEVFKGLPKTCIGYMNRQSLQQDMDALTLENMMIKKNIWSKVKEKEDISKDLEIDVEISTQIRENALLLVYDPWAESVVRKER